VKRRTLAQTISEERQNLVDSVASRLMHRLRMSPAQAAMDPRFVAELSRQVAVEEARARAPPPARPPMVRAPPPAAAASSASAHGPHPGSRQRAAAPTGPSLSEAIGSVFDLFQAAYEDRPHPRSRRSARARSTSPIELDQEPEELIVLDDDPVPQPPRSVETIVLDDDDGDNHPAGGEPSGPPQVQDTIVLLDDSDDEEDEAWDSRRGDSRRGGAARDEDRAQSYVVVR
jgi:hypothetical protein